MPLAEDRFPSPEQPRRLTNPVDNGALEFSNLVAAAPDYVRGEVAQRQKSRAHLRSGQEPHIVERAFRPQSAKYDHAAAGWIKDYRGVGSEPASAWRDDCRK